MYHLPAYITNDWLSHQQASLEIIQLATRLNSIDQRREEFLRSYYARFKAEMFASEIMCGEETRNAFWNGLWPTPPSG